MSLYSVLLIDQALTMHKYFGMFMLVSAFLCAREPKKPHDKHFKIKDTRNEKA